MSEIRHDELEARLHAMRSHAQRVPSPAVRVRVMQAWDARQEALRTPRRLSLHLWLPVAASLTIVVSLMIGSIHHLTVSRASVPAGSTLVDRHDVADSVLTIPDASLLPRFDHGELIRVEIPSAAGAIQAEVLVGQDGLARAIRVIQ